jgi:hypothetical protein
VGHDNDVFADVLIGDVVDRMGHTVGEFAA